MKSVIKYEASGFVYGYFWGGGEGAYPSEILYSTNKNEIIKLANDGLDGSLDSGMGFESLIGAILLIVKITNITINNKVFTNREYLEHKFIGSLTKKQKKFLKSLFYE